MENLNRSSHKIGRNERCPCGSTLKYKNCCLVGPRKASGAGPGEIDLFKTMDRLAECYPPDCLDIVCDEYFRRPFSAIHGWLDELPDDEYNQQRVNAFEWVVGESLDVDDEEATRLVRRRSLAPCDDVSDTAQPMPFLDFLLFDQDRRLTLEETVHLQAIPETAIGLYDVVGCVRKRGVWLREADRTSGRVFAYGPAASSRVERGDLIAVRVLPGEPPVLSGSLFIIQSAAPHRTTSGELIRKRVLEHNEPAWKPLLDLMLDQARARDVESRSTLDLASGAG